MPYKTKEEQRKRNQRYYLENRETYIKNSKRWYQNNKEKVKEYGKARRQARVAIVNKIKNKQCCKFCHENEPICLDFHHRNPKFKKDRIANMVSQHTVSFITKKNRRSVSRRRHK